MKSNFQIITTLKWEVERGPQNREKEELSDRKTDRKTDRNREITKDTFPHIGLCLHVFMFPCAYMCLCSYLHVCIHSYLQISTHILFCLLVLCFVFNLLKGEIEEVIGEIHLQKYRMFSLSLGPNAHVNTPLGIFLFSPGLSKTDPFCEKYS